MPSILLAILLVLFQGPLPKHLSVASSSSLKTATPGSKVSLYVDVAPKAGIHVYAPGAKDYLPIALKLDAKSGVTIGALTYPKSQTLTFEGTKVPVYDKPFRLVQEVTLDRSLESGQAVTLTGTLDYQACDDRVCFIPAKAPVSWTIAVR
jgi:DsbC/DsbD-like thiol-disulfide interchange protein